VEWTDGTHTWIFRPRRQDAGMPIMLTGGVGGIAAGSFAVGREYGCRRPDASDRWLLFATTAGRGRIGTLVADPGTLVLIRPRTPHDYATAAEPGGWTFRWAWFDGRAGWLAWLDWGAAVALRHPPDAAFARIVAALDQTLAQVRSATACAEALATNALELALILAHEADGGAALDPRVRRALAELHRDPAADLPLARLAARCHTSVSRLTAAFRAATGTSPRAYRERLRLEQAERLLRHSSLPVAAVAEACGYPDAFHFSRRFRRHHGRPPRVWRRTAD